MAFMLLVSSCTNEKPAQPEIPVPAESTDIKAVETVLPQAGNVALIEANCVPCHSLRYIEMQPQLSYKAWEKIVDKMITAYGAPIRDSATKQDIINYLYAIKGKKEH
jgi:hypothetical protein